MKEKINIEVFKNLSITEKINQIVKHYSRDLYWVIRPIVKTHENTDDVLQNTLMKIYRNLSKFRYESSLFSWMYRIAVNESLSFLKKNKKFYLVEKNELLLEQLKQDPFYDGEEILLKLEQAIMKLPPRQQEIFRLKYFSQMKYEEMASLLGVSVGSLKASYHLAVKKIKTQLNL